jgi:small GTP-binding protein
MGKTALFDFFCGKPFPEAYSPSTSFDHVHYATPLIQMQEVPDINIWDTCGDPARRDIVSFYLQKIDVAVIVTDTLSSKATDQLNLWFDLVQKAAGTAALPAFIVVRTKCDEGAVDPPDIIESLKAQKHCDVISVSVKTGDGMDQFVTRIFEICQDRQLHPPPPPPPPPLAPPPVVKCGCRVA